MLLVTSEVGEEVTVGEEVRPVTVTEGRMWNLNFYPMAAKFLVAALASASASSPSSSSSCTFVSKMDCEGDDIEMHHSFGANQTACCLLCNASAACAIAVLATDQGGVCMLKSACSKPRANSANRVRCLPSGKPVPPTPPPPPSQVPKWVPTYNMSESTVVSSGAALSPLCLRCSTAHVLIRRTAL